MKGRFNRAIQSQDVLHWEKENGELHLAILAVSNPLHVSKLYSFMTIAG